ncbi:dihydrolipoamide acetyltransferase family protein [Thermanaerothrix sp. 4228-RoL]|uniref:Dihydrolipoamide acetyltransferase component of pyruvate dehydrogenase complex n=2 Tax=Thermanaerothrix TaxID=1077886 RepID=A0ABU3NP70_9CHLR|nr:dihydrolipoamide acetyltransferase family protein [Thermanaerothrix sp. 4228-RoL]MDT8898643.1 dihydrolipoamide acetyltransferase family protein [Thermanaerothrix sp. 4228-RoL]
MATPVIMPQLGESVVEGTVLRWLKQPGEAVAEFEPLLEVSTDKVDSEIPSPAGGIVLQIVVPAGQTVRAGTVLAWIGAAGEALSGEEAATVSPTPTETPATPAAPPPPPGRDRDLGFISPVVARLAREHNLDLRQIQGTGEGGRITKKDVLRYLETHPTTTPEAPAAWETPGEGDLFRPTEETPAAPPAPSPKAAEGRLIPLTPMRQKIAERLSYSARTIPHVTTVMEADLKRVVTHYTAHKPLFARDGVNLTYTAYFALATVAALRAYPLLNASWTDEGIRVYETINLGIAVSLGEEGLVVPVIRQAEGLSLLGMARAINDLATRARGRRLTPEDLQGGTFTITNHGVGGSLFATPIILPPQCAILGVGKITPRPVVVEDAIAIRPMVYLSLTFDHRILDGAVADAFLSKIVQTLQTWPEA